MKMAKVTADLTAFFEPNSIAIIGSFRPSFFGGYVVVKSLLHGGYAGRIVPVNPSYKEVLGLPVYPSLKKVKYPVDLALIMINSRSVPYVIKDCAQKGVKAAIIVADGFAERDAQGARLQREIVEIANQAGIRLMGPNTAGVVNTHKQFYPCPYESGYDSIRQGAIALVSQTGMTNPQAFPYSDFHCGISKICDLGNKCDVDECDLLQYLADDESTSVVGMYLESIKDGNRFLRIARSITTRKPVLVVKAGRTSQGAKASASHTGSMAVNDLIFDAVCRQSRVLRLDTFAELFDVPKIFATQPPLKGNRLGILTITGGMAVMALDCCARYGLKLATLGKRTVSLLDSVFPGSGHMPVDIGPMMAAVRDAFSQYPDILDAIMADENIDALLHILWAHPSGNIIENYIRAYKRIKGKHQKPIATWIYGPNSQAVRDLGFQLEDMGYPVFKDLDTAVKALGLALQYANTQF
ncbi:MAG: hypothetical protein DRH12_01455 [Deltaproteobacteria bacterium]|nr:MAG: hypothetical protein DRH12_01455 [Deltaproteobacteria bacterium]RLB86254.1 MAG: hypothetical protein DRH15_02055 [Deltaproteobacteria bacterium]